MLSVSVCQQDQNALHRALAVKLDEHCCSIGPEGPQSLLLFGSEILTLEMATASASTKPPSSCTSDSLFKLSDDESACDSSLREPRSIFFSSDSTPERMAG